MMPDSTNNLLEFSRLGVKYIIMGNVSLKTTRLKITLGD